MQCLLCESNAVADALCVPCGAKKWTAELWHRDEHLAGARVQHALWVQPSDEPKRPAWREAIVWHLDNGDRILAALDVQTREAARAFLDRLEAARKAREAAPLCSRGCTSHEDVTVNSYGGAEESDVGE